SNLESVRFFNGAKFIGSVAFYDCPKLKDVELPDSLETFSYRMFFGCTSLKYTIEGNLCYIGSKNNPYMILHKVNSYSPTAFEIKPTCKFITDGMFNSCYNLTSIDIPSSVICISNQAFFNCSALTSVTLHEGLKEISSLAFENCSNIQSINLPSTLEKISGDAFSRCSSLSDISISNNAKYFVYGNALYENITGGTKLIVFAPARNAVTIKSDCIEIGDYAFYRASNITSVSIPSGVTSIGRDAFHYCTNLEEVTFLGNSVTSFVYYTFANTKVSTIRYPGTIAQWQAIEKMYWWNSDLDIEGDGSVVCSNGNVTIL
ncbi:MAG: leucine-rich repeat protein, partial [Bacilli bacterium]|nr:leucine-rich repeat protein [Bacilli bacterium]